MRELTDELLANAIRVVAAKTEDSSIALWLIKLAGGDEAVGEYWRDIDRFADRYDPEPYLAALGL